MDYLGISFWKNKNNVIPVHDFESYEEELQYYEQKLEAIKKKIKDKKGSFFGASQALYNEKMELENQIKILKLKKLLKQYKHFLKI